MLSVWCGRSGTRLRKCGVLKKKRLAKDLMRGRVSNKKISEELRRARPVPVTTAVTTSYPLGSLDPRRFEILVHALLEAEADRLRERGTWYDKIHLLREGADGARDISLYKNGSLVGVVQCKRLNRAIGLSFALNELLRYCLFATVESMHVPPLRYELWSADNLTNDAARLFLEREFFLKRISALTEEDVDAARGTTKALRRPEDPQEVRGQAGQALAFAARLELDWVGPQAITSKLLKHDKVRRFFFRLPDDTSPALGDCEAPEEPARRPRVERLAAVPAHARTPRPVNLLMVCGVDRRPSVSITLGVDPRDLFEALAATEDLVRGCCQAGVAGREWRMRGNQPVRDLPDAAGVVWAIEGRLPSPVEIGEALDSAFREPRPACGDVIVLALAADTPAAGPELVDMIAKLGRMRDADRTGVRVPIYVWRKEPPAGAHPGSILTRLMASLDPDAPNDRNADVEQARLMRLRGAGSPDLLRSASREALRLYDLSLVVDGSSDRPGRADEQHAVRLIAEAVSRRELLHGCRFLPVSTAVLEAFVAAPLLTRAVSGLLTVREMRSAPAGWPVHLVDGFRSTSAAEYLEGR